MFQQRLEVVLIAEGEDEVSLIDDQDLERVFQHQVSGLDVGDDSRRNADDDVGNVADEKLLLSLDALDVGNVDAADDAAAAVGQLLWGKQQVRSSSSEHSYVFTFNCGRLYWYWLSYCYLSRGIADN